MGSCLNCEYCKFPRTANDNGGACKCKIMRYKTIDVYVSGGESPAWCPLSRGNEYIKRDDVLKVLTDAGTNDPPYDVIPQVLSAARRKVKRIPAVEVVPKSNVAEGFSQIETLIEEYIDGLYNTKEFIDIFHELKMKYTEN